jgi:methylthioribose-1-phosphate isomerase
LRPIEWKDGKLRVLDQRLLPVRVKWVELSNADQAFEAIRNMTVRGAPLIGVVASFGLALELQKGRFRGMTELIDSASSVAEKLVSARPTAVNLKWALDRMMESVISARSPAQAKEILLARAEEIMRYEEETSRRIGEIGEPLIEDGDTILTHCNAGSLATVDYGTALAPIRFAVRKGKSVRVIATETRPALQGARLTAFELMKDGIDVTLISDTMVGYTISLGMVDKVILGADRVLRDGHVTNKIGTYQVAVLAKRHGIPFYSAMPWSSVDMETELEEVKIEQRSPKEVEMVRGRRIAPKGVKVFNPAFDITPPELVTALITDRGIIYPPFAPALEKAHRLGESRPVIISG